MGSLGIIAGSRLRLVLTLFVVVVRHGFLHVVLTCQLRLRERIAKNALQASSSEYSAAEHSAAGSASASLGVNRIGSPAANLKLRTR
jgi:hypothetical protein